MPVFQVSTKLEKRRELDEAAVGEIEHEQQPELGGLIDRADDQRRDQAEARERAAEVIAQHVTPPPSASASHSRSAWASRGVTSG